MAAVGTVRGALPAVALPPDRHPAVPARLDNTGVMVHAYPVVLIALRVVVAEVWVHRRSAHAAAGCGANQALRHTATLGPIRHRASQTRRISPVVRLVSTCAMELVFPQPLPAARPPGQAIRRAAPVRVKRGVRRAMAVPAGASLVLVRAARPVARARQVSTGAMALVFQAIVPAVQPPGRTTKRVVRVKAKCGARLLRPVVLAGVSHPGRVLHRPQCQAADQARTSARKATVVCRTVRIPHQRRLQRQLPLRLLNQHQHQTVAVVSTIAKLNEAACPSVQPVVQ